MRKWSKYEYNIYFKVSEKKNKIKMGKQLQIQRFNAGEKTIFKKKTQQKKMDIINTWKREGEVKSHGRKRC